MFMYFFIFLFIMLKEEMFLISFLPFESEILLLLTFYILLIGYPILTTEKFWYWLLIFAVLMFFSTSSFFTFYFMFELSMFPIMMIIMIFGYQPERLSAAFYLFFYGLIGGFPLILMLASNWIETDSLFLLDCCSSLMYWVASLGFMIKTPLFIFHSWLPKAHVEAPTVGSVLLAGVLLKLGTYGLIVIMHIFTLTFNFYMLMSMMGMVMGVFLVIFSSDVKSWIALSSVVHMNSLVLSLMTLSMMAKENAIILMYFHGVISSVLFVWGGILIHSSLQRNIHNMIALSTSMWSNFMIITLMNSGVPPFMNFIIDIELNACLLNFCPMWGTFWSIFSFGVFYYNLFLVIHLKMTSNNMNISKQTIFYFFFILLLLINIPFMSMMFLKFSLREIIEL